MRAREGWACGEGGEGGLGLVRPTCMEPKMVTSQWPPRIIPKEASAEKYEAPGRAVIVCLPAFTRSASSSLHSHARREQILG